ncbi:MAG: beta-lactamase family protein [Caldilineaceae bacterium]|nr:beta-lactamase family protein [Caldilineaceae bacterium]
MRTKLPNSTKMIVMLAVLVALVLLPAATMAQSAGQNDEALAGLIDEMLAPMFTPDAPGAAVIVVRDGDIILRKGYGLANVELGVPVQPEMVFRLASVTKQFTALAILMLSEEGKLALSDDISKHLPDYPTHGQTITIEHLLTHTAGVKDLESLSARRALSHNDLTREELIALFKDERLDFAPGEAWSYSNSGYVLLGAIIEQVSGLSYAEFIQQRIFTPLGMTHSYYDDTTHLMPGRVAGYSRTADGYTNAEHMSMTHPYAAGSLASSVDDLARWDAALYTGKLVKPATLRRAFKPYVLKNGQSTGYGYGWVMGNYEGHPIAEHNGGINGFHTQVMRLPADKVYVAILTNMDNPPVDLGDLAFSIAARVIGRPYQDPLAITLPASMLAAYEGVYLFNGQPAVVIRHEDDHLTLQTGGPASVLRPLAADEFFITSAPSRIKFTRNDTGKVTELHLQKRFTLWLGLPKSDQPLPASPTEEAYE